MIKGIERIRKKILKNFVKMKGVIVGEEEIKLLYLNKGTFFEVQEEFKKMGVTNYIDERAFTVTLYDKDDNLEDSMVVMNVDCDLNEDEWKIAKYHEIGHACGYHDEEEADEFAMEFLNEKQRKILKDNWKLRHNCEYE
jgi:hypothetical protein